MNELEQYIKDTLGVDIKVVDIPGKDLNALPYFIGQGYEFTTGKLFNKELVFMMVTGNEIIPSDKFRKQLDIVKNAFNKIIVAVIPPIEAYNRSRLIEKKIPFIIPGKQMYLPDLLIDFKETAVLPREIPQNMQPAAQFLLLFHIQTELLEGINLKNIAEKLNYQPMTITRAVYYLHNMGLCKIEGTKDKFLQFEKDLREIWKEAEPLMTNPIKKTLYYTGWLVDNNTCISNIKALAHYTDISEDLMDYYAIKPGYTRFIGGANLKPSVKNEANIYVEEWKYNPYLLTKTKFIDPLSLYLCFRNSENDRIKIALETLMEKIKW